MTGDMLRRLRLEHGIGLTALARRMGTSKQNVAQMERVRRVWPETALRYIRALYGPKTSMSIGVYVDGDLRISVGVK